MNEILKALIFGGCGYALGSRITDKDVENVISSYLRAVTFDDLVYDWKKLHPGEYIDDVFNQYIRDHSIYIPKEY